jgi:peptide/nickel transport system permease protein
VTERSADSAVHTIVRQPGVPSALLFLFCVTLTAALSPLLPFGPTEILDPVGMRSLPPSWTHPLGTDPFARDVLSRMARGTRASLGVAVGAVLLATCLGTAIGMISGLRGGWTDRVLMRATDAMLSVPRVLLLLTIVGLWGGLGLAELTIVLGTTGWMSTARVIRSEVMRFQVSERRIAAYAIGLRDLEIVRTHLVGDLVPLLGVYATGGVAQALLLESGLSFLGLGVSPPDASWGSVLLDLSDVMGEHRWLVLGPGLALVGTVISLHRLGDALLAASQRRSAL